MSGSAERLKLGENQRRVVSVLLRGLEQMCDEVEGWLEKKPGTLSRVRDDLTPEQRTRLRGLVGQRRGEIARVAREIELDPALKSPAHVILALVSTNLVSVEETDSSRGLRGALKEGGGQDRHGARAAGPAPREDERRCGPARRVQPGKAG